MALNSLQFLIERPLSLKRCNKVRSRYNVLMITHHKDSILNKFFYFTRGQEFIPPSYPSASPTPLKHYLGVGEAGPKN